MTYPEAIKYLESFINYENIPVWPYKESLKLERFKDFLALIGNPQKSLKVIHVAGSKGKGSTCAFIAYILREANFYTGLYTSPHLSDFRERIRILKPQGLFSGHSDEFEGMISKNSLTRLVQKIKPAIIKYNRVSLWGQLSFFEVYTALALVYFQEKKVDFVVLETGLGGRLDATNMADSLVAVITPISYEHTQKLGNTLREIAGEKAGIIKSADQTVISAPQVQEARVVIRKKCRQIGTRLYEVGKDIKHKNWKLRLIGRHQLSNAASAVGAVEALRRHNIKVSVQAIKKGLYNSVWPGRCEVIAKNPLVILDGAQNVASCRVLQQTVKDSFKFNKVFLVLGVSSDKDIPGICREIGSLADLIILTKARNARASEPEALARFFPEKKVRLTFSIKEAWKEVLSLAKKEDLVLVTGSLFVVGEVRAYFRGVK